MRFDEFNEPARKQLAERKGLTEEQLDEILPAVAAIAARAIGGAAVKAGARAVGGALAKTAGRALGRAAVGAAARGAAGALARGAGRAAGRAAGSAVRGAGRAVAKSIGGRDRDEPQTNDPNTSVGTQTTQRSQGTQGTTGTQSAMDKAVANKLKPGKTLKLPSQTASGKPGPAKNFKVSRVKGDEIEIQNPAPKPGEPQKFVFNKSDLEGVLSDETK